MVGDSVATDVAGGREAGMFTIWLDAAGDGGAAGGPDLTVRSLPELRERWRGGRLLS
jgi:FMN phosphatase YigB (HAD superfamily)